MHKQVTPVRWTWGLIVVFGLLGALAAPTSAAAQDGNPVVESLVDFGALWSYLDTGVDPGPGWELSLIHI